MKKTTVVLSLALAALASVNSSLSFAHGHGHGGYHGGGYGDGYGDGFLAGLLASTYSLAILDLTANHKELVYIGAADEAAAFIAEGGAPSALLREAMDTERALLDKAGVAEARGMSDEDLAFMVMGRADQLQNR